MTEQSLPNAHEHVEHCRKCKGRGYFTDSQGYGQPSLFTDCSFCNGTGKQMVVVNPKAD